MIETEEAIEGLAEGAVVKANKLSTGSIIFASALSIATVGAIWILIKMYLTERKYS